VTVSQLHLVHVTRNRKSSVHELYARAVNMASIDRASVNWSVSVLTAVKTGREQGSVNAGSAYGRLLRPAGADRQ